MKYIAYSVSNTKVLVGCKTVCTWWRPSRSKRRMLQLFAKWKLINGTQLHEAVAMSLYNKLWSIYTVMHVNAILYMHSNAYIYINLQVYLVVIHLVSFFGSCPWHSTLTVTMYSVPGFSDVMLRWWSVGTMLMLAEAPSECHCCHKSMYLPLVQQDSLWYQTKLIQVVPTVQFSIMGERGPSMHVRGKVAITRQCICIIMYYTRIPLPRQ